jgi:hypothetical protein
MEPLNNQRKGNEGPETSYTLRGAKQSQLRRDGKLGVTGNRSKNIFPHLPKSAMPPTHECGKIA